MSDPATDPTKDLGFADDHEAPLVYLKRITDYYLELGYDNPYRWAHYRDVPFQKLEKPLSAARVAIVTTAAPYQPDKGDQGPGAPYNAAAKFYRVYSSATDAPVDVRVSHVTIDRAHTTAEDMNGYFPLAALKDAQGRGRIGAVAPRFHGAPTDRSQVATLERDCPELLKRLQEDGVDAVVLVPNCPVCHQTVSLSARYLEANGIATVIMGCAKDIVERCGVPRFLFSDFPLGNGAGRPNDPESQALTLDLALSLLETAAGPRTTMQSPLRWNGERLWKEDFFNVAKLSPEEVAVKRAEFDKIKRVAKERHAADAAADAPADTTG